ncbi:polysaccharide biosynthesis protein [Tessaracoccus aquimaris]|uniref:polysaccharide biosynthesis protein n=1 Tax=Tessaracoccus aquimaris TaxID=1332264 RepID=UPI001D04EE8F|nr:nucleoside-diphosphate sugar epimerase/dehydratase [Tessaracoccus aquimaris]
MGSLSSSGEWPDIVHSLHTSPAWVRRSVVVAWDIVAWVLALLTFALFRFDWGLGSLQWFSVVSYILVASALQMVIGLACQIYLGRSRIGSFSEAFWLTSLVLVVGAVTGAVFWLVDPGFPRSVILAVPCLALLIMSAGRGLVRMSRMNLHGDAKRTGQRVLLYGAGDLGHQVAHLVARSNNSPYSIVGILDDDPTRRFLRIEGHRVVGTGASLAEQAQRLQASAVVLAIGGVTPSFIGTLSTACEDTGVKLIVVPPVREMIGGKVSLESLREFNVADLLGRRPISTDLSSIAGYVTGRTVLVTGAGGSIGSELAHQVNELRPSKLVLLDRDESALHAVQLRLYGIGLLDSDDMVLCSIRDEEALRAVFEKHRPDVVFHAAALKHLPMLQQYPAEAWKTNVLGTANVLRCAHESGVRNLVNISTDKAADASSVLGGSKRIAERLTGWYAEQYDLAYVSVRFGNVLGSRGSVLHTFKAQIERGGPVTVTDPDVTRYFMTIPEACELVLQAGALGRPGEVMVLDMGEPVRMIDVAQRLIAESGKDIAITFTGLREGEKLDEVLFSVNEHRASSPHPLVSSVRVEPLAP